MKKIVGIITRPVLDRLTINREVSDVILEYGCLPIGIIPPSDEGNIPYRFSEDIKIILSVCDGVILQGGEHFYEYDKEIVKYLYEHDIPTLGICLGMQTMAMTYGGQITDVGNVTHKSQIDYVHPIIIRKDSKLFEILGKKNIVVNSRHLEKIVETKLNVVAHATDGIIEAVEEKQKRFFIGVEWHPESIVTDENSKKLFSSFFECI